VVFLDNQVSPLKDAIVDCQTWGLLKQSLISSLEKNSLATKVQLPENQVGWHGEKLPPGLICSHEARVYIWEKDGSEMVYVPAQDEKTKAYYIDRYEVTWAQYLNFCQKNNYPHLEKNSWSQNLNHPAVYVSWKDATEYCKWAGKSLPTEDEWEKAARGTDGRKYPWGNEAKSPLPACYASKDGTMPVGSFPQGVSFYGCMDMAGNAAEWCENWYDSKLAIEKVMRGGSWLSSVDAIQTTIRRKQKPALSLNFNGFRCVLRME
jgi:formylglycine-generating enzyme required for sulfatase activity